MGARPYTSGVASQRGTRMWTGRRIGHSDENETIPRDRALRGRTLQRGGRVRSEGRCADHWNRHAGACRKVRRLGVGRRFGHHGEEGRTDRRRHRRADVATHGLRQDRNGLRGEIVLVPGANVTLTPSGNTVVIAAEVATAEVAHDTTLMGAGSATAPLGIAVPLPLEGAVQGALVS